MDMNIMVRRLFFATVLVAGAAPVVADEVDVNVGFDALRLGYVRSIGATGLELDFSYLNDDGSYVTVTVEKPSTGIGWRALTSS